MFGFDCCLFMIVLFKINNLINQWLEINILIHYQICFKRQLDKVDLINEFAIKIDLYY